MMRKPMRVVLGVVAGLLTLLGLSRLRLDTDVLSLLPTDLPVVRALQLHQRHFASARDLFLTVRGPDAESTTEMARSLAMHLRGRPGLTRQVVWTSPWEERPDLAAELVAAAWLNQPKAAVDQLRDRLSGSNLDATLRAARERLTTSMSPAEVARTGYDPLGLLAVPGWENAGSEGAPRFVSEDGLFRLLMVTPALDLGGYQRAIRWNADLDGEIEAWRQANPEWSKAVIRKTGAPAFSAEISQAMERDMRGSVLGTLALIVGLFWWAHRAWRPLLRLGVALLITLVATLAAGGFVFERLNAVSLGFAAILLGLAVDYGLVIYQETRERAFRTTAELRREVVPGILWAAITTSVAFGAMAVGGLPGLAQLGVLVALGTLIAGIVMVLLFARIQSGPGTSGDVRVERAEDRLPPPGMTWRRWATIGFALAVGVALAASGWPRIDVTAAPLRPGASEAYAAMDEMRTALGRRDADPWWLIAEGATEAEVGEALRGAERVLGEAVRQHGATQFQLPTSLWPDVAAQRVNRGPLGALALDRERFRGALENAGFNDEATRVADVVFQGWRRAAAEDAVYWPTNEVSRWVLGQVTSSRDGRFHALGMLEPVKGPGSRALLETLRGPGVGVQVGGWDLLGSELLGRVEHRMTAMMILVGAVWLGSLVLAFREWRPVLLAIASMTLAFGGLMAAMGVAGWEWNLMNLMAVPIVMGSGADYAIHVLLALKRHDGDVRRMRRTTGRAVFLCAATTVAGFGSLAWASNAGLASLGKVSAVGLAMAYVLAVHLLPAWATRRGGTPGASAAPPATDPTTPGPSGLYRAGLWGGVLRVSRWIPRRILVGLAMTGSLVYAACVPGRRRVVAENLAPLLEGGPKVAGRAAWRLFVAFGRKLADLWIYETGRDVSGHFVAWTGWERLQAARASRRGILLLTPHLGNWEYGAPLLAARGIPMLVITLAEPGEGLTEMRQAARARWGIETYVVGQDPFALVELIRRLQEGAVVALLVDRPPRAGAVPVTFLGRPFFASGAAADLARATGCVLLPVILPWDGKGYGAHVLPEIPYDRRALGSREARGVLTQDILRAFESPVRQYADQWFHFVPVWPS